MRASSWWSEDGSPPAAAQSVNVANGVRTGNPLTMWMANDSRRRRSTPLRATRFCPGGTRTETSGGAVGSSCCSHALDRAPRATPQPIAAETRASSIVAPRSTRSCTRAAALVGRARARSPAACRRSDVSGPGSTRTPGKGRDQPPRRTRAVTALEASPRCRSCQEVMTRCWRSATGTCCRGCRGGEAGDTRAIGTDGRSGSRSHRIGTPCRYGGHRPAALGLAAGRWGRLRMARSREAGRGH